MNLRLPVVLCIVGAAGAAAVARTVHPPAPAPASLAFAQDDPSPPARATSARARPPVDAGVVVYVAGAVARGGVYHVGAGSRAVDALRAAGGATSSADLVAVNLAAPLADGDEVIVPEKGAADDVAASDTTATPHHKKHKRHRKRHHRRKHHSAAQTADLSSVDQSSGDGSASQTADTNNTVEDAAPAAPIDLNAADASELETLPGIGAGLAERIVSYRDLNGPFAAPDDLLDVGGMTQKRLDAIEPFLVL
jgi:competence protein ComEA